MGDLAIAITDDEAVIPSNIAEQALKKIDYSYLESASIKGTTLILEANEYLMLSWTSSFRANNYCARAKNDTNEILSDLGCNEKINTVELWYKGELVESFGGDPHAPAPQKEYIYEPVGSPYDKYKKATEFNQKTFNSIKPYKTTYIELVKKYGKPDSFLLGGYKSAKTNPLYHHPDYIYCQYYLMGYNAKMKTKMTHRLTFTFPLQSSEIGPDHDWHLYDDNPTLLRK